MDSNVFRYVKPNHPSYNSELHSLIEELKDQVLFIFSDAHLDDLRNSSKQYKLNDLSLMGSYTKDNFFTRNPISNEVTCKLLNPLEADSLIDDDVYNTSLKNPFNFDDLLKDLDDSSLGKAAKDLLNSVFNSSIASLGTELDTSNINDDNRHYFDKMFPGYDPNMSLKDFMNSLSPLTSSLLNNTSEVSELRNYIGDYINSEDYSFEAWGLDFNERVNKYFGKSFLELVDGMLLDKQKNDFYLRFYYAYSLLEMYNITIERSGKKRKKFTYQSLMNDSVHGYFASMCDLLVTDDKGLQVKAAILYELYGIDTKILSSSDFVNNKENFLKQPKAFQDLTELLSTSLKNSELVVWYSDIESRNEIKTFKLRTPILNFFTTLHTDVGSEIIHLVLTLSRYWHHLILMYREIELIIAKCNKLFGKDDDERGAYNLEEKIPEDVPLRTWYNRQIQLTYHSSMGDSYINLHIYLTT